MITVHPRTHRNVHSNHAQLQGVDGPAWKSDRFLTRIPENYTAGDPRANYSHYVTHVRKTK